MGIEKHTLKIHQGHLVDLKNYFSGQIKEGTATEGIINDSDISYLYSNSMFILPKGRGSQGYDENQFKIHTSEEIEPFISNLEKDARIKMKLKQTEFF